jgi:glycerophosphoryl diester phosphodiesterase
MSHLRTTVPTPFRSRAFTAAAALSLGCSAADSDRTDMTADRVAPLVARPLLVAHRGASGYAPEHTIPAYELAIAQGADFIEPDLQITKDGRLIALHDLTLERTTNVRDVYPDRFREEMERGERVRRWYAVDFTLEEIQRLDAGSWFDASFAGARVPTLAEVIEVARGRAGIFPETKAPETYRSEGYDMERLLVDELRAHGLERRGADPATPVYLQSFSAESLRVLRHELGIDLHSTFLLAGGGSAEEWITPQGLARVREFADGIGPSKQILLEHPEVVSLAHRAGLTVIPYTFRADDPGRFPTVADEMAHFLFDLRVDGLFTNNPDLFPRTLPGQPR